MRITQFEKIGDHLNFLVKLALVKIELDKIVRVVSERNSIHFKIFEYLSI